jgi:hypothetical protein
VTAKTRGWYDRGKKGRPSLKGTLTAPATTTLRGARWNPIN